MAKDTVCTIEFSLTQEKCSKRHTVITVKEGKLRQIHLLLDLTCDNGVFCTDSAKLSLSRMEQGQQGTSTVVQG